MTFSQSRRLRDWPLWAFIAMLALAFLAYRPGLSGGFLFDDFVNLPALGASGPIDNAPAFWRYLTSGTADPTGRPIALLSFLLDARDWPADPAPFLRTNVLLHLLNGGLLFVLLRVLGRRVDGDSVRTDGAAMLGAALWLLHPFFVSTTLYVVQREAILPATFTLCGLLAWVHAYGRLATAPRAAIAWMLVAIGVFTPLATASKANGILLPMLAWVVDANLLRATLPASAAALHRRWRRWLLVIPSVAIVAYLVWHGLPRLGEPLASRPWTIGERLLTEPRVLLDYLQSLVIPRTLTTGLYNDAYVLSTSLLQPASTAPALLAILALIGASFALRRRAPALATALLFFFAGHLLESSVIALELYFEHRNYLPALLLGWPLARAIAHWHVGPRMRAIVAAGLVLFLAVTTWQRSMLWAQQDRMALLWAAQNPASSRAQATAAIFETKAGRADLAVARLDARVRNKPGDLQLALNRTSALCHLRGLSPGDVDAVAVALRTASEGDQLVHRWLGTALDLAQSQRCPGLDVAVLERWLAAAQSNPRLRTMPGRQQDLHSLAGRIALARGEPRQALREFDRALDAWPTPQAAAQQAGMLATRGCYAEALAHLDHYSALPAGQRPRGWSMQRLHAAVLSQQDFWPGEMRILRERIEADLRMKGSTACMH
jgi:protein O-mannosyl-transferase